MSKVRILVADDHSVLRAGLRLLIDSQRDMQVVAEAADGAEAVRLTRALRPDVVLLDISMPRTNGIATLETLTHGAHAPRVVVLTMHDDSAYLHAAMAAGARGYVVKRAADTELISAIRAVSGGRVFVDAAMAASSGHARGRRLKASLATARGLSPREAEVVRLLAEGHTNREVAERLGLSVKTAETFRARAAHKLGLTGRADLVRFALRTGLLNPEHLANEAEPRPRPGRPPVKR